MTEHLLSTCGGTSYFEFQLKEEWVWMQPLRTKALRKWRRGGDGGDNFFGFYLPSLGGMTLNTLMWKGAARSSIFHSLVRSFSDVWGMGFIDRIPRRCWLSRPRPHLTRWVFTQERFCVKTKVVVFLRSTVYPLNMPLTQEWILVSSPNNCKWQFLMRHCADDEGTVQIQFWNLQGYFEELS